MMNLDQILNSGDLELIARLDGKTILKHFGEDSFEYLAYEHRLAELLQRQAQRSYRIPRRTENPAETAMGVRSWIGEFHKLNGMDLPTGFSKRNGRQLRGMYYGMLEMYKIDEGLIFSREELELLR